MKWIYIIIVIVALIFGSMFYYEYKYPCVRGHYEQQWQTTWTTDANGNMMPMGGYYADVFVCDCRTTRDSIK